MNPRLQLALELAQEASDQIVCAFALRNHALTEKSGNDFATETDQSVEAHVARRIAHAFPGDRLLGEEGGERRLGDGPETGVRWIVDPLDGTFNFVHGFPYVATSIAVEEGGEIQVGVIANPLTGEIFSAGKGSSAWRHRAGLAPERLSVANATHLNKALVGSVLPSAANVSFDTVLPAWIEVARAAGSIRRTGAAALDLAHVAAGQLDGFFVMSLTSWDAAAGALLVREAGGMVCDFAGGDDFLSINQVIAGTRAVAGEMARILQTYAKRTE